MGPEGCAWRWEDRDAALTLAATYPSGYPAVVQSRDRVWDAMLGETWHASCGGGTTTVRHAQHSEDTVAPGEVYVGGRLGTYPPTPWAPPPSWEGVPVDSYEDYVTSRADITEWAAALVGKVLVCDCSIRGRYCHAAILAQVTNMVHSTCGEANPEGLPLGECRQSRSATVATARDFPSQANHTPSGRRTIESVAMSVAAERQPLRAALPQLVPDTLDPEEHLRISTSLVHPFQ